MANRSYLILLAFVAAVGLFHLLGTYLDLYFIFPLYDVPMHFLGGLSAGLIATILVERIFVRVELTFTRRLVWILAATLFAGVLWEMFEFYAGVAQADKITVAGLTYWADTVKDLAMDLIGGVLAIFIL